MKLKQKVILILILVLSIHIVIISKVKASTVGIVTEITVNVREDASTDSKIVARVTQDDEVEVIEKSGDWYKIKTKNKTGYVYAQFIKVDDSKISEANIKDDEEEVTKDIEKSFYISKNTKLSIAPNISSNIIYTATENENIEEIEQLNGWSYIKVNNNYGWVRTESLTERDKVEEKIEQKEENPREEKQETKNVTKYVKYDKVNLRKEPSVDSKTLQKLSLNTKVIVIEEVDSKWSKVKVDSKEGYISTELLSNEEQEEKNNQEKNDSTTSRNSEEDRKELEVKEENKKQEQKEEKTETNKKVTGEDIVNCAKKYLGYDYVYGGSSPKTGFDCSGFTYYVYKQFGYTLSRSSKAQANNGTKVEKENLKPGDLVIYKNSSLTAIGHVGIYIGNNKMIHASEPGVGVVITDIDSKAHKYPQRYVMGRRIIK